MISCSVLIMVEAFIIAPATQHNRDCPAHGAECLASAPVMQHALLRREADVGFGQSAHPGMEDQPPFSRLFLVCGKAADVSVIVCPPASSLAMHCMWQPAGCIDRG